MYITVVQPGEDLAAVARRTGVALEALAETNGLPGREVTAGLALIVPSNRYIVQPGDTLTTIADRSGVSLEALRRANPGIEQAIYPGRPLRIPEPVRQAAEMIGYLPLTDPGVTAEDIAPWARQLTWVALFSHLIDDEGNLPPIDDIAAIRAVYAAGARPLMSIANMRAGGAFDPELARRIITQPAVRERVISNTIRIMNEKGYAGVDSDIENIPREMQAGYVDFLSELKHRMGDRPLNVAVPPKFDEYTFGYARGHDYAGIGRVADRVYIMNYEFSWVGGPPGPIAPLPQYRRVLQYAVERMPRSKILAGISTVAYDWELPDTPENVARPWPHNEAVRIAIENRVPIGYNEPQETPWFRYRVGQQEREVWFEDARSLLEKFEVIRNLGLRGYGVWHLGALNSQLISLANRLFAVQR
ncbi:MAG: glycosyl hydrolase family 18 protein [Bacillota bacterium]